MKKYALWIAEKSATGLIVGVAMAAGIVSVAYAASGNGLFADVLNKIVSNGNYQTTDGTVLQATKVLGGTATDLYTSNGTTGEWTGATNVKVGDSDKVDGLHASELAGGLSAAGGMVGAKVMITRGNNTCPVDWDKFYFPMGVYCRVGLSDGKVLCNEHSNSYGGDDASDMSWDGTPSNSATYASTVCIQY